MDVSRFDKRRLFVACCALGFASFKVAQSSLYSTAMLRVIGKKVCPEPNRNPCDKGRLHAGHSIAQQCPSAPPLHLFR